MNTATHCQVIITTYSNVTGALDSREESWERGSAAGALPKIKVPGFAGEGQIAGSGLVLGISGGAKKALGFKGIAGEGVRVAL